ncbi:hypothetical protein TIFTF001_030519 [Ficus carica]|uniref:Uncharacterized protein n=1 Tax=Ficus carica TaxID=3494 RepID=A0AA88DTX2_FICCA|nr:hypothetical protein TIFTF001_030519 [Ficus carica]
MKQGKNKIKHHYDKQDAYVLLTRVRSGLVHGLSWTGLAASNHSMAMYHGKRPTGNT